MSERQEFKGNYLGFTYNGRHSSTFGIVRTSDGSRFNENLLPTMQDKTVQVPGGDGMYYFGSYYTQRQFSVSFAFDSLTDRDITDLKRHFGDKKIHDLIFDETPYKVWSAKVTGTATLKYVPFIEEDEENTTGRLYKGEGSIQFTCYYPFARCRFLPNVTKESLRAQYPNIDEWWDAARIEPYTNFGDVDAPFEITVYGTGFISTTNGTISWENAEDDTILNTRTGMAFKDDNIANDKFQGNLTMKIPVGAKIGDNIEDNCIIIENCDTPTYDRLYI